MSISRVWLRWLCVSRIPGITVLPARFTRVAPAGTRTSAARPTAVKRLPVTMNVAFSIGARPSPTMTRAPSKAITPVVAGACASIATDHAATAASVRSLTRRIAASSAGILVCRNRFVPKFLSDQLRGIGARLRAELLHAAVEHFRQVQIAVLIGRHRVRSVELAGLLSRSAPPVYIVSVQVVLHDAVRPAIREPEGLVGGDQVRVRR